MKRYLPTTCLLFVCNCAILFLPKISYGQLNGNYTINPTKAASNTNYKNWASAVGDLISGSRTDGGTAQGAGVSGPVTISVYDTLYNSTQVAITSISGASYSNTITFKSIKGDSSKCLLRYASSTTATDDYVLLLDGADYITFKQIGMERTGSNTYSTVVQITNDADNNKLIRCLMKARKMASSSSLGFSYGIGSAIYFMGNGDSTEITQNRLLYGYNGIFCTTSCTANLITGNLFDTSGSSGIYMTGQTSIKITGNTFNMGDFGAGSGHYTSYGIRIETSPGLLIANNKIFNTAVNSQVCRALVLASNTSSAATPSLIYNNWIYNNGGTGSCTGLAVYNCYYLNFFYNNVLINNSLAESAAYYQYYGTYTNSNLNLVNNNLINKGAGYSIDVRDATNYANIDSLDYNNLYSAGTYLAYWNATKYTTLSSLQTGSGKNNNSVSLDPGYISNSNLHVSNIAINGKALAYPKISFDIDNETRNMTTPDIGADEFFPIPNDAGISALDSPIIFCAGKQNVKIRFQNYGSDTIKTIQIAWMVNGTAQTGYGWTGKVAPGASSGVINLGNYNFSSNTAYNFKLWTKSPNGAVDGKNINDTLQLTRYAAMSGAYTIGDTTIANYKSFSQAITAMTERGLCGAVTFNVYNGNYNEQLGLAKLPGMGASSPLLFQSISKDSSKVKVSLATTIANGSNNAALQLRGAVYVTFKGITFERTGTNPYGHVIHILNNSNYNTFTNCQMIGISLSAASATAINIWSDQSKDDYNVFRNNYIKYGNYNMQFTGVSTAHEIGTLIANNTFEGGFKNALQLTFNDSLTIIGNTFLNVNVSDSGTSDIHMVDCDKLINISGNFFKDNVSENAIRLNGCNASASSPGIIANNSILKSSGTGLQANKGIYINGSDYQNVVFNSLYFSGSATTNAGIYSSNIGTSNNIMLKNNNIVMESGEVVHIASGAQVSASNNNNLLGKGTQFAYWGASYNTLTDLTTATGKDLNSLTVDPLFISTTNLHIRNPLLKGAGVPVTDVTKDFDNELRNTSTPDIGADEFKLVANDAGMVTLTKPLTGTCTGILNVEAVIKNFGGDTLKNAIILWSVSGVAQTPYNWKGKLPTNGRDTVIIGSYNFTGNLSPKFIIKSNLPNGNIDGIPFNDSTISTRTIRALPVVNLGSDATICLGDSLIIGVTNNSNFSYKWYDLANNTIGNTSLLYAKPKSTTTYILEVTNNAYGCVKRDSMNVNIHTKFIAEAGPDLKICLGSNASLGKAAQTGYTYSWTSQPSGFSSTTANPSVNPSASTTYYLQKTATATSCKAFDTTLVTVNFPPISQIIGPNTVCLGEQPNYNTKVNSGNTYNWMVTGGNIQSGQNTNIININWTISGIGTIQVIEASAAGCKDTASFVVTVSPKPKANFSISGFCKDYATNFTNLSANATTYDWKFGDGGTSLLATPSHVYVSANTFPVRLIAINISGCSDTATKLVSINPSPVATYSAVYKINRTIDFSDSSKITTGTINTWLWEFGDGDTSQLKNPSHQFKTGGNFAVRLCVSSVLGCTSCITKNYDIVGVNTKLIDRSLSVVPNPGTGIFVITSALPVEILTVINSIGQTIEILEPGSSKFSIDLSEQPAGIYFIKTKAGNQSGLIKLIKE